MPATTTLPQKAYRDLSPEELEAALAANAEALTGHFDERFLRNLALEIIEPLSWYFRPKFVGFDEMPERNDPERPLIYACNHSGMAFPWDAIMLGAGLFHQHNYELKKLFRPLSAPMLSASRLMNPFQLRDLWKRVGALDATSLNFETLMRQSETNVLIYPEGVPGIGKGFNRRYQLQPFSTSMIRMAIKYRTDIIGISCINGEYINPMSLSFPWINRLVNKIGIPFLPMSIVTLLIPFQPWIFYMGFPAQLTYVRGPRFKPYEMVGDKSWEEVDEADIRRVRDAVQVAMQAEMDRCVGEYGQKPFHWRSLFQNLRKHWWDLPYWIPIGWPALFTEYDRRYHSEPEPPRHIIRGWFRFWRIVWKNPIIIAYFIPILGWVPLFWRGLRGRKIVKPWEGPKG
ncbi:MAG: hypothetical protein D6722_28265 [Bacteroidetes bacterium]|nr:MAG: hypothetical protein D6722_28265 [Bacteroidota bacterium]